MKYLVTLLTTVVVTISSLSASAETSLLFIGNSFTYAYGSAAKFYRADSVTDLNNEGIGGVPALFKSFADQAGLDYDVYLETRGGSGLDFHLENKLGVIGRRPWDRVVMHGFSTLDSSNPNNPAVLIDTTAQMSNFYRVLIPMLKCFSPPPGHVQTLSINPTAPGMERL